MSSTEKKIICKFSVENLAIPHFYGKLIIVWYVYLGNRKSYWYAFAEYDEIRFHFPFKSINESESIWFMDSLRKSSISFNSQCHKLNSMLKNIRPFDLIKPTKPII